MIQPFHNDKDALESRSDPQIKNLQAYSEKGLGGRWGKEIDVNVGIFQLSIHVWE